MVAWLRKAGGWLQAHPHTLVSLCIGLGLGAAVTMPLGWTLPDSAAALLGAVVGAGAAVGGALWAANAKQAQEVTEAHVRQRHIAQMVASAIAGELAAGQRVLAWVADQLNASIEIADKTGDRNSALNVLSATALDDAMCTKFIDRLDTFGKDASGIVGAVSSILEANATMKVLTSLITDYPWAGIREIVVMRTNAMKLMASNLHSAVILLANYHPSGSDIVKLLDTPDTQSSTV